MLALGIRNHTLFHPPIFPVVEQLSQSPVNAQITITVSILKLSFTVSREQYGVGQDNEMQCFHFISENQLKGRYVISQTV